MPPDMPPCVGPGAKPGTFCGRPSTAFDLCHAHYRQWRRDGEPKTYAFLRPLRPATPPAPVPRVHTSIRVSPECAEVMSTHHQEAREVLEAWARGVRKKSHGK